MEVYLSEEERVEALKRWWKENSKSVVIGVSIGMAAIYGWNVWQNSKLHKAQEASSLYQQMLKAVDAKQVEPATKLGERLIEQYQGTAYATYAPLFTAKLKAESGDLAGAKQIYHDLLISLKDDNLKHVVRLRLGNLMLVSGESEAALKLIEVLKRDEMGEYESQYEELKGDLYGELHRVTEARAAYEKAKLLNGESHFLDLKINDLPNEPAKPVS